MAYKFLTIFEMYLYTLHRIICYTVIALSASDNVCKIELEKRLQEKSELTKRIIVKGACSCRQ